VQQFDEAGGREFSGKAGPELAARRGEEARRYGLPGMSSGTAERGLAHRGSGARKAATRCSPFAEKRRRAAYRYDNTSGRKNAQLLNQLRLIFIRRCLSGERDANGELAFGIIRTVAPKALDVGFRGHESELRDEWREESWELMPSGFSGIRNGNWNVARLLFFWEGASAEKSRRG
jgi:hypothetical protein